MENDLFAPVDLPGNDDPDKDYLSELVGEGKKFSDYQGLARGKAHSDRHIQTLEKKLDEMKQELNTRLSMEDFMTKMKDSPTTSSQEQQVTPDQNTPLDDSTLEQKIAEVIARRDQQSRTSDNLSRVSSVMTEHFGEDANIVINKKAQELRMSPSQLKDLSLNSPDAFFTLMGVSENREHLRTPSAPRSSVTQSSGSSFSPLRNAQFYEKMKRDNPKLYFDNKTTVAMIKDMSELGDKW